MKTSTLNRTLPSYGGRADAPVPTPGYPPEVAAVLTRFARELLDAAEDDQLLLIGRHLLHCCDPRDERGRRLIEAWCWVAENYG